jgi:tetratricopeptide (TPR) repeat protein
MAVRRNLSLITVLLAMSGAARADQPAIGRAQAALWAGQLQAALTELQAALPPAGPSDGSMAVQSYLDAVTRVDGVERHLPAIYARGGRPAAQDAATKVATGIDDPALAAYVRGLLAPVDQLEHALHDGDEAFAKKDWAAAHLAYERVQASAFAADDERELARVRLHAIAEGASPFGPLAQSLRELPASVGTVLRLLTTFMMVLLFIALGRIAAALFTSRHEFAISSTTGVGEGKALGNDAALTARLIGELRDIAFGPRDRRRASWEHQIDALLPHMVGAQLRGELETLAQNIDATQQLTLGELKVPMRALWTFCVELVFPRSRFQWAGIVDREDGETRLTLTRRDRRHPFTTQVWYEVSRLADADLARDEVLQRMAYRIVLEAMRPALRPTRSAAAFCAYERAVRILEELQERVESRRNLQLAKVLLQQAIHADPSLWQARLRLGIVLRKLGESDVAMALFDDLLRMTPDPETRLDLRYHRAVVEAQKGSLAALRGARTRIEDLCHELERALVSGRAAHLYVHESPVGIDDVIDSGDGERTLAAVLALLNRLRVVFEGDERLIGHRLDDVAHPALDLDAAVTRPAARTLADALVLANQLRRAVQRHLDAPELHHRLGVRQVVTSPVATDLPSLVTLVNELRAVLDRHLGDTLWQDAHLYAPHPTMVPSAAPLDDADDAGDDSDDDDDEARRAAAAEPLAYEISGDAARPGAEQRARQMLLYFYTRSFHAEICARMWTLPEVAPLLTGELEQACRRGLRLAARLLSQPPPAGADPHALNLARGLALYAEGRTLLERGNSRGARASLARAVACLPTHPGAQVALARVYRQSRLAGSFALAQGCLENALALDQSNGEAHEEYGKLLLREEQFALAAARLQLAVDELGRSTADLRPGACFVLGVALAKSGKPLEALMRIERGIRMSRGSRPFDRWAPAYYWRKALEVADAAWAELPATEARAVVERVSNGFAAAVTEIEQQRQSARKELSKHELAGRAPKVELCQRRVRELGLIKRDYEEHKKKIDLVWARLRLRMKDGAAAAAAPSTSQAVPVVPSAPSGKGPVNPPATPPS